MPPVLYVRERDERLMEALAVQLNTARMGARQSILDVAARSHTNKNVIGKVIMTGNGHTITMLRIADALDCDVVLVKRVKQKKMWEIPGAEEQLFKMKQQQLNRKRNERSRKQSLRDELDRAEREQDFLADDDDPQ